jgi:hypothetical protein
MKNSILSSALFLVSICSAIQAHSEVGQLCNVTSKTPWVLNELNAMWHGITPSYVSVPAAALAGTAGYGVGIIAREKCEQGFNYCKNKATLVDESLKTKQLPDMSPMFGVAAAGLGSYVGYKLWQNTPEKLCNRADILLQRLGSDNLYTKRLYTHNISEIFATIITEDHVFLAAERLLIDASKEIEFL